MNKADRIKRASVAGSVTSEAKAKAARDNGKLGGEHGHKGGRPPNPEIQRIKKERGVSRQRAWQIFHAKP